MIGLAIRTAPATSSSGGYAGGSWRCFFGSVMPAKSSSDLCCQRRYPPICVTGDVILSGGVFRDSQQQTWLFWWSCACASVLMCCSDIVLFCCFALFCLGGLVFGLFLSDSCLVFLMWCFRCFGDGFGDCLLLR
jgi:hypothetical protein